VETAGKRNLQTRTYKQEKQLIQVAIIGQLTIKQLLLGNGSTNKHAFHGSDRIQQYRKKRFLRGPCRGVITRMSAVAFIELLGVQSL
jgi:hypothetical protein